MQWLAEFTTSHIHIDLRLARTCVLDDHFHSMTKISNSIIILLTFDLDYCLSSTLLHFNRGYNRGTYTTVKIIHVFSARGSFLCTTCSIIYLENVI